VLVLFPLAVSAQQSINFATLSGHVEDATGGAVSGATVRLLQIDRNQSSIVQTDAQGRFRFHIWPWAIMNSR